MGKIAMKSCLMTGASGFVGSNVLAYLLENTDWQFTVISSWKHKGNPLHVPVSNRVEVITHDLTAPIPDIGEFDYIFHLASESHVDRSISDPVSFIENNISITLRILEYAREHKPKLFLHFSTDEVYGAMDHEDWDVLLPSNPYAASKAAQEMIAIAYWKTYKIPLVITNSNNIIGPNQDPEKFVPKIVKLIKQGKRVPIHITNNGPGKRFWNPVENVASALLFITGLDPVRYTKEENVRPDRFSIGGGTELNNFEMAQLVARLLKRPLLHEFVNAEVSRPGYDEFYASVKSELELMGWKPPIANLEDALLWIA